MSRTSMWCRSALHLDGHPPGSQSRCFARGGDIFHLLAGRHQRPCPSDLLLGREMHEPNHSIQNFNDGATRLANVAVVLSTSSEVTFSDVDDKNLKQLLLAQWSFGAHNPLQDVVDY